MSTRTVHTIADIAQLAGVSKSTVSRALNDSPLIKDETKDRIRSIAEQHDFQLNVPARRLSLQQSHTVAFVTYAYQKDFSVPDVFMLEIMSGISNGLNAGGYDMLVIHVDPLKTNWAREYLETGRVDGFILLSATCTQSHIKTLVAMNAPFVIWGTSAPNHGYCSVTGDNVTGGRIAVEHLLRSGRGRVAFLGGPARSLEVQDRYRGYEVGSAQRRKERGSGARRARRLLRGFRRSCDARAARAGPGSRRRLRQQRPDGDRGDGCNPRGRAHSSR